MNVSVNSTYTISAAEAYGGRVPATPKGFTCIDFRIPKAGEIILTVDGRADTASEGHRTPRYILADSIERQYGRHLTEIPIPGGFRIVKGDFFFRAPRLREWYLTLNLIPIVCELEVGDPALKRLILEKCPPTQDGAAKGNSLREWIVREQECFRPDLRGEPPTELNKEVQASISWGPNKVPVSITRVA